MAKHFIATAFGGMLTLAIVDGLFYGVVFTGFSSCQYSRLTLVEPFITMVMVAIAGAVVAVILARSRPHGVDR